MPQLITWTVARMHGDSCIGRYSWEVLDSFLLAPRVLSSCPLHISLDFCTAANSVSSLLIFNYSNVREQPTDELFQGAHRHGSSALKGISTSKPSSPRSLVPKCVAFAGLSTAHPSHATARTSSKKVLAWIQQRTQWFVKRWKMQSRIPGQMLCAFSRWWIRIP